MIDVITDYPSFIRNPQQGGENSAPTQGVEKVDYYGEIVAIVVAESFEAARDAATRVRIDYEPRNYVFAAHRDQADTPAPGMIPPHSAQGDVEKALAEAATTIDATYTTPHRFRC